MKLSLNWLQTFVDCSDISPELLGETLTLHTAEVEEIIYLKPFFENVFAGKLVQVQVHPESKNLNIGTFDLGKKGKKQIVFGSKHLLDKGGVYPVALDGARLRSGINIKKADIRGVASEGMVCDNVELGYKNEAMTMFREKDVGKSLPEICQEYQDVIIDIDNKSLTHRPDLMGHRGFARELAASLGKKLNLPEPIVSLEQQGNPVPVSIQTDKCQRFCALNLSGIEVAPAALFVQIRLENLGIRAISNIVDITNWILLEFGQPMHAFDAKMVKGELCVRQAKNGERLVALDEKTYELTPNDTVVADDTGVLSIAGIMGGQASGITEGTTNIILECAGWDATAVRKTSQRLGLRSESSMRYEKSLDPFGCRPAILASSENILEILPKSVIQSEFTDKFLSPPDHKTISLSPDLVRVHSGISITNKEIVQKLESIGFSVTKRKENLHVQVPTYRATKDIDIPEDLVEEVVRLYGLAKVPAVLPELPVVPPQKNNLRSLEWKARAFLAARGFLETYNYSFVSKKEAEFTGEDISVEIQNPLSEEGAKLRQTLIFNHVNNIESDLRTCGELDFFEIGKVFYRVKARIEETRRLLCLKASLNARETDLFFETKKELQLLLCNLGLVSKFLPNKAPQLYTHPTKNAEVWIGEQCIGVLAAVHPNHLPVKNSRVVFAELNFELLNEAINRQSQKYIKSSPFPAVRRDLSVVLPEQTLIADLEKAAFAASKELKNINLFDEFTDAQKLGKGLKNLAFHLVFQAEEKTLEEAEIDDNFKKIVKELEKTFEARLRLDFDRERG